MCSAITLVESSVIALVGSHRLVEFIWGYLGEYLEISVMSAVRRGPRDDFGEFCQIVAILG